MDTNGYEFTYVLYVYPGNNWSDAAIREVHWGPNELSADGQIKFQDIRALKKVYGSYPGWLQGVPTLVNVKTERQWIGELCIKKLKQWKKEWTTRPQKSPAGAGVDVPTTPSHNPNKPVELPPDPMKVAMEEAGWKDELPQQRPLATTSVGSGSTKQETGDDLMSQLKARMVDAPDVEPSFNFPPPDRDPLDAATSSKLDLLQPVDPETVPGATEARDDDVRTVKVKVSLPKEPKTPTRRESAVKKSATPTASETTS